VWHPKQGESYNKETKGQVEMEGVKLKTQTFSRRTTDTKTFAQAFSRSAQHICWAFEDMEPSLAIERYSGLPARGQDEPLRGIINDFSSLLTPDQFDTYTLQEELNRSLTAFCLKHHPSKFRKRRWEVMRCTSPIYLLDPSVISFDGVSDSRVYTTHSFPDGRPSMVQLERDQESSVNLDQRTLFSHRTHYTCAWLMWHDGPYTIDNKLFQEDLKNLHKSFTKTKNELEDRFSKLYKLPPHLQARLQRAFNFLDIERDGTIDHSELKDVLSRTHGRLVSDDEAARAMKELDPSGNGTVEPSEFIKYMGERGSLQGALLPIANLDAMCRTGFEIKLKKGSASPSLWPSAWLEVDPFAQVLSVYDAKAIGSYDAKQKQPHLKKTLSLVERSFEHSQDSDSLHTINITKKSSSSSLTIALAPKQAKNLYLLLQRCVSSLSAFELEATPIVQELLVEAALPALVQMSDE
jgi:hypothetical protein